MKRILESALASSKRRCGLPEGSTIKQTTQATLDTGSLGQELVDPVMGFQQLTVLTCPHHLLRCFRIPTHKIMRNVCLYESVCRMRKL